jgi:hypothetical protein
MKCRFKWFSLKERVVNILTVSSAYLNILREAEAKKWSVKLQPNFDFKNETNVVKEVPLHCFKVTNSSSFNY